ncbi:Calx-beta domain-containing protein [Nocardioides sp. W7]|uniref:Calx-beta domain-containing protein n=1 Tax=Nocardioides sp. W7 TaxID=2931390 RepID=UPI001FD1CA9E|nr:Calx-beta domain-containing protein [Nocardioides sp. W7]
MSLLPRSVPSQPILRIVLLLVGAVALVGGAAWTATAAGLGTDDDARVSTAAPAAAEPAQDVKLTGEGLVAWLDAISALEGLDQVAENAPFGAKEFFEQQTGMDFVPFLREKIEAAVGSGIDLSELDTKLDDIDGDGDPASDFDEIEGVTVDLDVDLTPKDAAGAFDVKITVKASAAQDSPLAMSLDGLKINGRNAADSLKLDLASTLRLDPSATKKIVIVADQAAIGTVRLGVDGSYAGTTNPLAFQVGILGVRATGKVKADVGVQVTLKDPNGDGVIDLQELAAPATLFDASCVSTGATVDLTVTAELAGITGKAGRITLADNTLCNGLGAPDVELGDLAQFRSLTLADVVNGLAQVTQALKSAQAAGDVPLPFVQEPLRDLVSVNERLVKFFVDNGFTDADNPMATITVDTKESAAVKSLQDLVPRLAAALGISPETLAVRYDAGRVLLSVKTAADPEPSSGTVNLSKTLSSVGVTEITGEATASIDPAYTVDLGVGFDLAAGKTLDQRFYLTNGAGGQVATIDADVTADLDIEAVAAVLGLRLTDADPEGAVPLLQRKDTGKPMFSLALTDPDKNGRTTLAELSAAAALPVRATVNATVPSTRLTAEANAVGIPLGSGSITIAWPSVPDTTDSGALKVSADQAFLDTALPFAFDPEDPRALISQVLTVTRETITRMRAAVADGDVTTTTPLPLVGRSVADLDPVLVKIQTAVDRLIQANELLTLPGLQAELDQVLAKELGHLGEEVPEIVTLAYEPRTATTPATVVVKLDLGACSTDRAEGREGCTVTGAPVDVPFNLDLGSGSRVGGVAGVGTEGTVKVGYDARANLTFGVQLPNVAAGPTPTSLPTPSGAPRLFVQDDAALDLGLGARVDGVLAAGLGPVQVSLGRTGDGEPKARAAVAARFKIAAPAPTKKRLVVGSPEFTTWLGTLLPKAGEVSVHETDDALKATCPGVSSAVDACATLPVYADSTSLGAVTFTAPDLLTPSGWDIDSTEVEENLKNEAIQFSLLVDGVRTLTQQIGDGLRSLPTGTRIPLLGTDVTAGADVLKTFDTEVLARVETLADQVATVATAGQVEEKALAALSQLPGGATPKVTLTCRQEDGSPVKKCADGDPVRRLQSLQVDVLVTTSTTKGSTAFDLGFPGFRLASKQKLTASAGLDVRLGFGVDRDLGFYVPTGGSEPEVALRAGVKLPATVNGDIAFIPVKITDKQNDVDDVSVTAGLDLRTSRPDGRLPLADLGRAQLSPGLKAEANLLLGLETQKASGALSAMPTFTADLDLGTTLTWNGTSPTPSFSGERFRFRNVTLDAGSLFTDVLKPVADTLHDYTAPLEKPIDAIRKPIPAVAEAARMAGKEAPTWYDAFKAADRAANGGQSKGLELIDRVITLIDLVRAFDDPSVPAGVISLGSFDVIPEKARTPVPLSEADSLIGSTSATSTDVIGSLQFSGADELSKAQSEGGFSFPAFDEPASLFGMLLGKDVTLAYFDAGKLEVKRGFQFSYPLGPARLYIGGGAGVEGHFAAGFDTYGLRKAFELLTDNDESNDGAWDLTAGLLQGLYLDDFDRSGKDVPEIRFSAYLSAGAAIGIPGIEAGAEGGVEGAIEFNLKADPSGKLRYTGIAEQLKINKNPLCFFDATATVDAYVKAYVDTFFGKATYPIVNKRIYHQANLFTFCKTKQEGENQLATVDRNGVLVFKSLSTPDDLTITQLSAQKLELSARGLVETYDGVTSIVADLKGGDDVLDVRQATDTLPGLPVTACGGSGSDRILVAAGTATVYGDDGGTCVAAVDPRSDDITTGSGDDQVDGGAESDTIDSGPGNDELAGGEGDDALRGGLGDDKINGGDGNDLTDYSDHVEDVTVDLAETSGQAGEQDKATSIEQVVGGAGDDTVTIPAGESLQVDGGSGDDQVTGTTGTAVVMGGDGADRFVGGTGSAQFMGGGGDDVFVDGPGSQTFLGMEGRDTVDYSATDAPVRVDLDGAPGDGPIGVGNDNIMDADLVLGTVHPDQLVGSSAAEELRGGAGDDALSGGGGDDLLLGAGGDDELVGGGGTDRLEGGPGTEQLRGGTGNDVLLGEADDDDLDGEDGNDAIDGGLGDDRVRGGGGADDLSGGDDFDWVDYSDRTERLTVSKDNQPNDGATSERDNLRRNVERYVGGSGTDDVTGFAGDEAAGLSGDEVFEGNDGIDYLSGIGGADRFDGGPGADQLYDRDDGHRFDAGDTHADTFVGGDGDDWAYGNGGTDVFEMGAGRDEVRGGPDADTFRMGDGDDMVYAGDGPDLVHGEGGDDTLRGEDGDDVLHADESTDGNTTIYGGNGADTIYNATNGHGGHVTTGVGSSGETDNSTNVVFGYDGTPGRTSFYNGALGTDVFHLGGSDDNVSAGPGADVVETGDGRNVVTGGEGNDTVTGGAGRDSIHGDGGDDTIAGAGADDGVYGDEGNDRLDGGPGDDAVWGYLGNDVLVGGDNADDLQGNEGDDTVSYSDRTTPITIREDGMWTEGGIEDVSVDPGSPDERDRIAHDVERYVGGAGADRITLRHHNRLDPVVLAGGPGDDVLTVNDIAVRATFVGGPGADTMTGNEAADVFDQGAAPDGADVLIGRGGADVADYRSRPAGSVRVTFDGVADDGAPGEQDNVQADVESAPGSGEPDPEQVEVTLALAPVRVTEGAGSTRPLARFTVTTSAAPATPLTVPWTVAGVTATAGADFAPGGGTVTVPAGATSASFDVPVLGDALDEPDETAHVTVGAAPGSTASAALTIVDDDPAPRVTVRSASVAEGRKGTRKLTFQVVLSAASAQPVSVRVATANGTAKAGSDYLARAQVVAFAPGQTVRTFVVSVRGDRKKERNESLKVVTSTPVNVTLGSPARGTIRNDDRKKR